MLTFAISHRTLLLVRQKQVSPLNKPTLDTYQVPSPALGAFHNSAGSGRRGERHRKKTNTWYINKQESVLANVSNKIKMLEWQVRDYFRLPGQGRPFQGRAIYIELHF